MVFDRLPLAFVWGGTIVAAWLGIAWHTGQPFFEEQHAPALVEYGAFKGGDLSLGEAWKLIASQWLHVKFPHMLFNALMIAVVGQALQARTSAGMVLAVGIGCGAIGQFSAAVADPSALVSGASQAYLALSGAALLVLRPSKAGWWAALAGIVAAVALDLFVSDHGALKPGHVVALLAGLASGASMLAWAASARDNSADDLH